MFTSDQIRELFDFLRWGDRQMLDAAGKLPETEYYKDRNISHGSIHKVLVHAMAAEWISLQRWLGNNPTRIEDPTDYPTRDALAARWPIVHLGLSQFLDKQTARSLEAPLTYQNLSGAIVTSPLGGLLFHVVDHGSYHRGQLNTMIKQAGGQAVGVNFANFIAAKATKKVV